MIFLCKYKFQIRQKNETILRTETYFDFRLLNFFLPSPHHSQTSKKCFVRLLVHFVYIIKNKQLM